MPGFENGFVERARILDRMMQLIAELPDIGESHDAAWDRRHVEIPDREEREHGARDVRAAKPLEQLARARTGKGEDADPGRDVLEGHRPIIRKVRLDPGEVVLLSRRRGN